MGRQATFGSLSNAVREMKGIRRAADWIFGGISRDLQSQGVADPSGKYDRTQQN